MSELHENPAPTVPLIAAAALVILSLVGVTWQKFVIAPNTPSTSDERTLVQSRVLQFEDGASGSVKVFDLDSGQEIDVIAAGDGGFLRGTLRGLVRERKTARVSMSDGFRLSQYENGTVVLTDLATGRDIDLRAFGETNAGNFLKYLSAPQKAASVGE